MDIKSCFDEENRGVAFYNPDTGEETVADGFVPEKGVVVMTMDLDEPVTQEELVATTYFHINNRRRIVWVFNEEDLAARAALAAGPDLRAHRRWYSACMCREDEPGIARRVINADEEFEFIALSAHGIQLAPGLDVEDFFRDEEYWRNQEEPPEVDLAALGDAGGKVS